MKLNDFMLLEAERSGSYLSELNVTMDGMMDLFSKNCKNANWSTPLYRGMSKSGDFYLAQGDKGDRRSAHAPNYYTLFFDESIRENKLKYPLRSKSIICSTAKETAEEYGDNVYVLFPFDTTDIAILDVADIQLLMINFNNRSSVNLLDLVEYIQDSNINEDDDFDKLIDDIEYEINDENNHYLEKYFGNDDIKGTILDAFNPTKYSKIIKNDKIEELVEENRECWIGGKCLMIKYNIWKKYKDRNPHQHELDL